MTSGISADELSEPPTDDKGREVFVDFRLTVFNVSNVDTRAQTAAIKVGCVFYWTDRRMIGHRSSIIPPTLWGPTLYLLNAVGGVREELEQFAVLDAAEGRLKRIVNYDTVVNVPMDLRHFPFDVQRVVVKFVSISHWRQADGTRHGSLPTSRSYVLRPVSRIGEGKLLMLLWDGYLAEFMLHSYNVHMESSVHDDAKYHMTEVLVRFHLVRKASFYYIRVLVPVYLLSIGAFLVHTIPLAEIGGRLKVWSGFLMASFSMLQVSSAVLPRIGRLTIVDQSLFVSLAAMLWVGCEAWLVFRLSERTIDGELAAVGAIGALGAGASAPATAATPDGAETAAQRLAERVDYLLFIIGPPVFIVVNLLVSLPASRSRRHRIALLVAHNQNQLHVDEQHEDQRRARWTLGEADRDVDLNGYLCDRPMATSAVSRAASGGGSGGGGALRARIRRGSAAAILQNRPITSTSVKSSSSSGSRRWSEEASRNVSECAQPQVAV